CGGHPTPASAAPHPAQRKRGSRTVTWPNSVAIACWRWSFTRHTSPQPRHSGRRMAWSRACAATISRWTPARSCLPSAKVRPKAARSVRSPGLAIRMTSVLCSSPSAPMLTSFTIQATLSLPHRENGL
ncbi:MAG: hypothetical protein AVDCRST_MAG62-1503, partial [uncultured Sphingomonas sp.]